MARKGLYNSSFMNFQLFYYQESAITYVEGYIGTKGNLTNVWVSHTYHEAHQASDFMVKNAL